MFLALFISPNFCVNVENKELKTRWHYDMLILGYVEYGWFHITNTQSSNPLKLAKSYTFSADGACFVDNEGGRRVLPHKAHYSSKNTIEICKKLCFEKGYQYAGVEYSKECFCGNNCPKKIAPRQTDCNMDCSGDRSQKCGGGNRLNVYHSAGNSNFCPA